MLRMMATQPATNRILASIPFCGPIGNHSSDR